MILLGIFPLLSNCFQHRAQGIKTFGFLGESIVIAVREWDEYPSDPVVQSPKLVETFS